MQCSMQTRWHAEDDRTFITTIRLETWLGLVTKDLRLDSNLPLKDLRLDLDLQKKTSEHLWLVQMTNITNNQQQASAVCTFVWQHNMIFFFFIAISRCGQLPSTMHAWTRSGHNGGQQPPNNQAMRKQQLTGEIQVNRRRPMKKSKQKKELDRATLRGSFKPPLPKSVVVIKQSRADLAILYENLTIGCCFFPVFSYRLSGNQKINWHEFQ